ncbi:MAG: hypothetical protein IJR99_06805, partial [Kiritimatiellae bacterium]|nr:hypothetical protein [Kiritimatiellia bacterium]
MRTIVYVDGFNLYYGALNRSSSFGFPRRAAESAEYTEKGPKIGAFCRIERGSGRAKKGSILHQMGEAKNRLENRRKLAKSPRLRVSARDQNCCPVNLKTSVDFCFSRKERKERIGMAQKANCCLRWCIYPS